MARHTVLQFPWMTENELHWLAGLLEGEGWFGGAAPSQPNQVNIEMKITDVDTAERAAALMGANRIFKIKPRAAHHKQAYMVRVTHAKARNLMLELRPLMSTRRRAAIDAALESYDPLRERLSYFGRGRALSLSASARAAELRNDGVPLTVVAQQLECSLQSVRSGLRRLDDLEAELGSEQLHELLAARA